MHNSHVKFGLKIPNRFGKIATNPQGGLFLTHTVHCHTQQHIKFSKAGRVHLCRVAGNAV